MALEMTEQFSEYIKMPACQSTRGIETQTLKVLVETEAQKGSQLPGSGELFTYTIGIWGLGIYPLGSSLTHQGMEGQLEVTG